MGNLLIVFVDGNEVKLAKVGKINIDNNLITFERTDEKYAGIKHRCGISAELIKTITFHREV